MKSPRGYRCWPIASCYAGCDIGRHRLLQSCFAGSSYSYNPKLEIRNLEPDTRRGIRVAVAEDLRCEIGVIPYRASRIFPFVTCHSTPLHESYCQPLTRPMRPRTPGSGLSNFSRRTCRAKRVRDFSLHRDRFPYRAKSEKSQSILPLNPLLETLTKPRSAEKFAL